jgi:hypothetical protein
MPFRRTNKYNNYAYGQGQQRLGASPRVRAPLSNLNARPCMNFFTSGAFLVPPRPARSIPSSLNTRLPRSCHTSRRTKDLPRFWDGLSRVGRRKHRPEVGRFRKAIRRILQRTEGYTAHGRQGGGPPGTGRPGPSRCRFPAFLICYAIQPARRRRSSYRLSTAHSLTSPDLLRPRTFSLSSSRPLQKVAVVVFFYFSCGTMNLGCGCGHTRSCT